MSKLVVKNCLVSILKNGENISEYAKYLRVYVGLCLASKTKDECFHEVNILLNVLQAGKEIDDKDLVWIAISLWNQGTEYYRFLIID